VVVPAAGLAAGEVVAVAGLVALVEDEVAAPAAPAKAKDQLVSAKKLEQEILKIDKNKKSFYIRIS
jgi:hypothetical protein